MSEPTPRNRAALRRATTKVPELTAYFWLTKILTTAMGESTSDFMNAALGPAIAVPLMLIGLWASLRLQFKQRGYVAWSYWLVVVMVAVFGTSAADALHVGFGIPYTLSTTFYLIVLAVILTAWYRSERTLSIHSIYTPRREQFYWATVLATFALGTAAGDLTATSFHLGFLTSGVLFAVVIAVPALAYWRLGMKEILAFWFAYITTRPLGASYADWLENPHHLSGLGLGAGPVSLALTLVIVGLVAYLTISRVDVSADSVDVGAEGVTALAGPQPALDLEFD
ncbi:MAG: hypothetical protein ABSG93_14165 [Solirubrobacteraceae bacterium]|jgi:uncharacterized membrane-anchored protein